MADLSVRFEEPESYPFDIYVSDERLNVEPTVGGLTGQQLSLLQEIHSENQRELGDDYLCEYEMFPSNQQGPAEYCSNEAESWSSFCSDHIPYEPDWDQIGKDSRNGYDL